MEGVRWRERRAIESSRSFSRADSLVLHNTPSIVFDSLGTLETRDSSQRHTRLGVGLFRPSSSPPSLRRKSPSSRRTSTSSPRPSPRSASRVHDTLCTHPRHVARDERPRSHSVTGSAPSAFLAVGPRRTSAPVAKRPRAHTRASERVTHKRAESEWPITSY